MDKLVAIPFLAGLAYLSVIILARGFKWIIGLSKLDKLRMLNLLKSRVFLKSVAEAFFEGLLHRRIFRKNPVLGYMHMSLAFGWFLLIAIGHMEVMVAEKSLLVPFYKPVFFRYFGAGTSFAPEGVFAFVMDLLLLFVLTGLSLAMIKRFKKKWFGLTKTTRLKSGDRIALTSLWLIFPLRLAAESSSAALYHNGSFLTQTVGKLFENFYWPETLSLTLWISYSMALGFFFVALPNSRYMHIPTEILYIFLRNAGITLKNRYNTYADIQVFSCSRCGICLDRCQLSVAGINDSQSVYLLKNIRNHNLSDELLFNCLMCGKCQNDCPVGIKTISLRTIQRIESTLQYNSSYDYLGEMSLPKADVLYFAGCMTHLSPGIVVSMKKLFKTAGINYLFVDEEKSPCCGRPLMLAGQYEAASKLIETNTANMLSTGAKTLVVSCPICYKVFKEDYSLGPIQVVFHADYILQLIEQRKIAVTATSRNYVYHDPCELGRGMNIYESPRRLLSKTGHVLSIKNEKEDAHCCGGSLGNLKITQQNRNILRDRALDDYVGYAPDILVTACPKCKKTFSAGRQLPVLDIAEIVVQCLEKKPVNRHTERISEKELLAEVVV